MDRSKQVIPLAAGFMVCLIAMVALMQFQYVPQFFMLLAFIFFLRLSVVLMRSADRPRHRDPYDLELLKEVHEREEREKMHVLVPRDEADIICIHCGHIHGPQFRVCPNCKRMP